MTMPPVVWYGIQGEGRGHATRSQTLVRAMRDHGLAVRIFTGGDALDFFAGDPGLVEIPLLRFKHWNGRISALRTLLANLPLAPQLCGMVGSVGRLIDSVDPMHPPAIVISDFEPFLARWAVRHSIPWMAIDHQHALTDTVLPAGALRTEWEGRILASMVEWLVPAPKRVISSFHHFPVRPTNDSVFVGCFLRNEILRATPSDRGHACAYLKDESMLLRVAHLAEKLPDLQWEVWSEGQAAMPPNATLRKPHPTDFIRSLSSCRWLLTTAGNQLLGEALSLGKPILAIPTPGQTEQRFNAMALADSECGDWCSEAELSQERLEGFLCGIARFSDSCVRRNRDPIQLDGTSRALEVVLGELASAR